jgi:hypothetical protein
MPHIWQSFSSDYPPGNRFLKTFPVARKAAKASDLSAVKQLNVAAVAAKTTEVQWR